MSYDICLYDREFLITALATGLGDWTRAPAIDPAALEAARSTLMAEGFIRHDTPFGEEWNIDTESVLAQVSVFPGEVAFAIPYSERADRSIALCRRVAQALVDRFNLGYHDPQSDSPEERDALWAPAFADLESPDPDQRRNGLDALGSVGGTAEIAMAVAAKLEDEVDSVRRAAACCLSAILSQDPSVASQVVVVSLGKALSDPFVEVRSLAAEALSAVGAGAAPAEEALRRALQDESYGPRGYAQLALDAIAVARRRS